MTPDFLPGRSDIAPGERIDVAIHQAKDMPAVCPSCGGERVIYTDRPGATSPRPCPACDAGAWAKEVGAPR